MYLELVWVHTSLCFKKCLWYSANWNLSQGCWPVYVLSYLHDQTPWKNPWDLTECWIQISPFLSFFPFSLLLQDWFPRVNFLTSLEELNPCKQTLGSSPAQAMPLLLKFHISPQMWKICSSLLLTSQGSPFFMASDFDTVPYLSLNWVTVWGRLLESIFWDSASQAQVLWIRQPGNWGGRYLPHTYLTYSD